MDVPEFNSDKLEEHRLAMMRIVGLWKDRADLPDTETYVSNLRDDTRLARLHAQWQLD